VLNMTSTLDGRASIGGRSSAIGNRADRELFHALRASVDAVMVLSAVENDSHLFLRYGVRASAPGRVSRETMPSSSLDS
jgi:riboflavin biosynthesis pyrimidine reductase